MSGAQAGAVIAAAGLAALLTVERRPLRIAGLGAWIAGMLLLAATLLSSPIARVRVSASDRPLLAALAVVVAAAVFALATWLVVRRPWAFAVAAVAAAPARIPLHVGGATANLLAPLYAVVAVGVAASAVELLLRREGAGGPGRAGWALAALVLLGAVSIAWSADPHQGEIEAAFFLLPFGFLLSRLVRLPPSRRGVLACLAVQAALAAGFALVALGQEATHHVFWNAKVSVANEYRSFFRVNSLFYDPSIFGRFEAVTIVLLTAVAIAWPRWARLLVVLIALDFAGLYFSYSQSSFVALAAGALVLGATMWGRRVTLALIAVAAVAGLAGLAVALHGSSANRVSSDRFHLVRLGADVVRDHPLAGAGLGGFARAAVAGTAHPLRTRSAESHTTPLTVLAELGPLGLVLYLAVLAAVLAAALRPGADRAVRTALLAAFTAIVVSSLFYNAFFEDPATWILIGLVALAVRAPASLAEAPA